MSSDSTILSIVKVCVVIFATIPLAIQRWREIVRKKKNSDAIDNDRKLGYPSDYGDDEEDAFTQKKRDYSHYTINGSGDYKKGRAVLEVIRRYVESHRKITFSDLENTFPKSLRGVRKKETYWGCVNLKKDAVALSNDTGIKRHFINDDETIKLADGTEIAVSSQWNSDNFKLFADAAQKLGFVLQRKD